MSLLDRLLRRQPLEVPQDATEAAEGEVAAVEGERGPSAVQRPPSLQTRLSNVLAFGLLATIGVGLLVWYYANWLGARADARASAESSAQRQAEGEINLRPLGRVDPPSPVARLLGEAPEQPPPDDTLDAWLPPEQEPAGAYAPHTHAPSAAAVKTPEDLRLDRQLAGRAFAGSGARTAVASEPDAEVPDAGDAARSRGELGALLRASVTPAEQAKVLPTRRLLLPKGAFLDCTLETALDSTLPGMTTCILATDTFSADGRVVLLERGTKLVGETRGEVRTGQERLFVLWSEARTPMGVIVELASPGTDELGRSGVTGHVNTHFAARFGAAILISLIDAGTAALVASQSEGGSSVVIAPQAASSVVSEVLRQTVNVPPTIRVAQGGRMQVLVARDVSFERVYALAHR